MCQPDDSRWLAGTRCHAAVSVRSAKLRLPPRVLPSTPPTGFTQRCCMPLGLPMS